MKALSSRQVGGAERHGEAPKHGMGDPTFMCGG